jgi:hypothetical protein
MNNLKLIATLGTTQPKFEHQYNIKENSYHEKFSFLAIKKHYDIDSKNIYIIGTKKTKEQLYEYIKDFNFIEIDETNLSEIFGKTIELLKDGEAILDLTQSFRSLSFGSLLGFSFSKVFYDVKDIFYAQVKDGCNTFEKECEFDFISLKPYEEAIDLSREINTFTTSWYVIDSKNKTFQTIHENLVKLSKKLLINDLEVKKEIALLKDEIEKLKNDELSYLGEHLMHLTKELKNIDFALLAQKDSLRFYKMAKLYYKKNLLLQTLTMLFEAIEAYLDEKMSKSIKKCKRKDKYITPKDGKYKWRNCLKNWLSYQGCSGKFKVIVDCENFRKNFKKVDMLRNNSAHVFISGESISNFKDEIKTLLDFFGKYMI